jgi:hypothetical protein
MPWNKVPEKWKSRTLHSGGPMGPVVKDRKQMVAIMLSEKRKAAGKPEYRASPLAKALGDKS